MAQEQPQFIEPVFDPEKPGRSLDVIGAQIPIRAPWLSGINLGEVTSRRLGDGYEIDGIREYEQGDDYRNIDWRATARDPDGELQVREHYADIAPRLWIVTDVLQDRYSSTTALYSLQNLGLGAVMATMQIAQNKGLPTTVVANDDVRLWSSGEAASGTRHLRSTAKKLAEMALADAPEVDTKPHYLADSLTYVNGRAHESVVVVVSNFRDVDYPDHVPGGWKAPLRRVANNNDVIAVELLEPWTHEAPPRASRLRMLRKALRIDDIYEEFREAYRQNAQVQQEKINRAIGSVGARHLNLGADDPRWLTSFRTQLQDTGQRRSQKRIA